MSVSEASPGHDGASKDGSNEEEVPEQSSLSKLWEQLVTLVIAIAIAIAIRAFVIEPFRIPSGSMLPTLLIGDHLFVNKFIYGIKVPFSDIRLPGLSDPERGDVVVFSVAREGNAIIPADKRPELKRDDFVKRIVGLPGDRVDVRGGRVYVNGEVQPIEEAGRQFLDERDHELNVGVETLGDCQHLVLDNPFFPGTLGDSSLVVPEGRYFMMGDNRDHSRDSRDWGTVRLAEFKGPAFILYWSWNRNGDFRDFLNPLNWWRTEKRWDRIFRRVRCGVDLDRVPRNAAGTGG
jgi:signal peptidase I